MTISSYKKILKQIEKKEAKAKKYLKHNTPKDRKFGPTTKKCKLCGNPRGHVGKYKIDLCRRCFRDNAKRLGFKKYN